MFKIRCTLDKDAKFSVRSVSNLVAIVKKMKLETLPIISIDTTPVLWKSSYNDFTII